MTLLLTLWLAAQGASLRGIHAVDAATIWASGSKGTVLLSTDAGKTWTPQPVPDSETLDFRSVYAFSAAKAYILSSGDKEKSRLFRTNDGGRNWTLLYTSHEGFLDGLKFWDPQHGVMLGDPVGRQLCHSHNGRRGPNLDAPDAASRSGWRRCICG